MTRDTAMTQLFHTEYVGRPRCYLWDVYATQWEPDPLAKYGRVVNQTNRDLSHFLVRWAIELIRKRVREAHGALGTIHFETGIIDREEYESRLGELSNRSLAFWVDFLPMDSNVSEYDRNLLRVVAEMYEPVKDAIILFGEEPIQFLSEYEQIFGLDMWVLESRRPIQAEINLRSRELLGGESGTFKVTAMHLVHPSTFRESQWAVTCKCGRIQFRTGDDLIAGTFAPCNALRHVDQLIQSGDLNSDFVATYKESEQGKLKIAQRDEHLAEVIVNHPMVGRRFGEWLISHQDRDTDSRHTYWWCVCGCGSKRSVRQSTLIAGESQSCGNCKENRVAQAFRAVTGLKPAAGSAHSKGTGAGVRETLVSRRVVHCEGIPCEQNGTMHVCLNQSRASEAERDIEQWEGHGHYDPTGTSVCAVCESAEDCDRENRCARNGHELDAGRG